MQRGGDRGGKDKDKYSDKEHSRNYGKVPAPVSQTEAAKRLNVHRATAARFGVQPCRSCRPRPPVPPLVVQLGSIAFSPAAEY
jgi:hypothetical protein